MSKIDEIATGIAKHAIDLRESPPAKYVETFKTAEPEPVKPEPPSFYCHVQGNGPVRLSAEQLEQYDQYERELEEYQTAVNICEAHRLLSANAQWRVKLALYILAEAKRQVDHVKGED